MIHDLDRSGYFGASDTPFIMGSWDRKPFQDFWKIKTGEIQSTLNTLAMQVGNAYEHPILEIVNKDLEYDKQVIVEDLLLRVNLDGNTSDCIYEVKTHKTQNHVTWQPPTNYLEQVWVQMYATGMRKAFIVGYLVNEDDYNSVANLGLPLDIDESRITFTNVDYNEDWINNKYLPRLRYLAMCLKLGLTPNESEINGVATFKLPMEKEFNEIQLSLVNLNAQKKAIEEQQAKSESAIISYMEQHNIKSYKNDVLQITYVAPTTRSTIDSKMLKELHPDIAEECSKVSITKPSLRVKVNE